jgi:hypothetical protein
MSAQRVIDAMSEWITENETPLDLAVLWLLVVGFAMLAVVKAVTWWVMHQQRDQTELGPRLRRQKIAETFLFLCLTILYGMGLVIYYTDGDVVLGLWQRMGIRLILAVCIIGAAVSGVLFIRALQRQAWGQSEQPSDGLP